MLSNWGQEKIEQCLLLAVPSILWLATSFNVIFWGWKNRSSWDVEEPSRLWFSSTSYSYSAIFIPTSFDYIELGVFLVCYNWLLLLFSQRMWSVDESLTIWCKQLVFWWHLRRVNGMGQKRKHDTSFGNLEVHKLLWSEFFSQFSQITEKIKELPTGLYFHSPTLVSGRRVRWIPQLQVIIPTRVNI